MRSRTPKVCREKRVDSPRPATVAAARRPVSALPDGPGPSLAAVSDALRIILDTGPVAAFGLACTWREGYGAGDLLRPLIESA